MRINLEDKKYENIVILRPVSRLHEERKFLLLIYVRLRNFSGKNNDEKIL